MKIAFNSNPLFSGHSFRGVGAYTRELAEEFKKLNNKEIEIDALDFSADPNRLSTDDYDVIHYTSFHPFFISLPFKKPAAKIVLTIHDLIPLIYPQHYPSGIKGNIRFFLNKFLVNYVDAIIAVSETSKKDICRFLEIKPEKIHVIYNAPREIFRVIDTEQKETIKKKYNLPDKFVLYVGDVNYNKNIPTLIKACKIINIPLVICGKHALDIEEIEMDIRNLEGPRDWIRFLFGKPHPETVHFKELLEEFKKNRKIIRLGFVSDEDLVAIYNLATVYCQPSYYEGFGLPVLEAFASGTPVVAAKTQALVEIGEDGALYANPNDSKEMAAKISELITNKEKRKQLVKKQEKIVKKYSWEKTAEETIKIYKKTLKHD